MMDFPAAVPTERVTAQGQSAATAVAQVHLRAPKLRQPTPMASPARAGKWPASPSHPWQ